jgi:hypothetical protein
VEALPHLLSPHPGPLVIECERLVVAGKQLLDPVLAERIPELPVAHQDAMLELLDRDVGEGMPVGLGEALLVGG